MRLLLALSLALALAAGLSAQETVRITVDQDGLYFVSFRQLGQFMELTPSHLEYLSLSLNGRPVPVKVSQPGGRLNPADGIIFYGERNHGPYSHESHYLLTIARNPSRVRTTDDQPTREDRGEALIRVTSEKDELFSAIPTIDAEALADQTLTHWYWKALPARSKADATVAAEVFPVTFPNQPLRQKPATLRIYLTGPTVALPQKLAIRVNDADLPVQTFEDRLAKVLEIRIPPGTLSVLTAVRIENHSDVPTYSEPGNEVGTNRRNVLLIDRVEIDAYSLLTGSGDTDGQAIYRILHQKGDRETPFAFSSLSQNGQLLYHVNRSVVARRNVVVPKPGETETVVCCSPHGALREPRSVTLLERTDAHLASEGAEYVVVAPERFLPLLEPLLELRRSQGLTAMAIAARPLYDTFTHGAFDPDAIRKFLSAAQKNWKNKPRYLLLIGDSDRGVDWLSRKEVLPCGLVPTTYNGLTASDAYFADPNGTGKLEIAVGRLPVRTKVELFEVIARIRQLENTPTPGTWRRTVRIVAGEPRFSPVIDALLERVTGETLTAHTPPRFALEVTSASENSGFGYPPANFEEEVIRQLSTGCIAFTYIGHAGWRDLDSIRRENTRYPVLRGDSVGRINGGTMNPVVALIACSTGEFDRPEKDSLAELLLRTQGGAAAVIASSRISHPLPDAIFGEALAEGFFAGKRLGDAVNDARLALLATDAKASKRLITLATPFLSNAIDKTRMVKEHIHLYNLLGDPALLAPLPKEELELTAPLVAAPGNTITINGSLPKPGTVEVFLERALWPAPKSGAPSVAQHRAANDVVVCRGTVTKTDTGFSATLSLPSGLAPGTYRVQGYLTATDGHDVAGTASLTIQ